MSSMNILGTYSGITMDTIDQLVAAEKSKGVKFTNQKTKIEAEQNAWKDVNSRLDNLFKRLDTLTKPETFQSRTVKSNVTNSSILSVSANSDAAEGRFQVHVEQLAEAARLTGAQIDIDSIHTELNFEGEFTLSLDRPEKLVEEGNEESNTTEDLTIKVELEDSLKDISDKINNLTKTTGVQASIVDNHLVLTDTELGKSKIKVNAEGLNSELINKIGLSDLDSHHVEGKPALFTVNGIAVERDSNVISDVVEGLTFTLTDIHEVGSSEVITVATDTAKTENAVKEFVSQYNSVMSFIDTQLDVGDPSAENNKTGALTGDGAVMRLQSTLRTLMTRNLEGNFSGEFKNLEDLGITLDREGQATLDSAKFQGALDADPINVARFFYSPATSEKIGTDGEIAAEAPEREGMSELLRNFIDTYISTSTTRPGIISTKNTTYDRMLKDISEQIEVFNTRVDKKRDRYIQQFTALDIAMMEAQSQMDYLYSQMGMGQTNQQ